jgi:hypothetical protein
MEEDEWFSIPKLYEIHYQRDIEKEEQRFVVKYLWRKGWGSNKP